MGILVDENTKIIVQGITGKAGSTHTKNMLDYGTRIAAGVRPGADGEEVHGIPVYNTVRSALEEHEANASILFVPSNLAKGAALEAIEAGIKLVVIIPEHVPLLDTLEIIETAKKHKSTVIGPNTPGLISPEARCKIGFVPNQYYIPGSVGVASRSGTLTYEIVSRLTLNGIGQTTCIGVGGDPLVGTPFPNLVKMFEEDTKTRLILLIGEIGGTQEENVAEMIINGDVKKPVVVYIAGHAVPSGKKMGHAGAIVSGGMGTIESKMRIFERAGVAVAKTPAEAVELVKENL